MSLIQETLAGDQNSFSRLREKYHDAIFNLIYRMIREKDEARHFPGRKVVAVDTTDAGDTFNGALAVALAEDKAMPEAIDFANAAAALSVTRHGAQASIPSRSEVDALGERD